MPVPVAKREPTETGAPIELLQASDPGQFARSTRPDAATLPHALPYSDVAAALDVGPELGLAESEAQLRLARFGPNILRVTPAPTFAALALRQFHNPLILLLLFAAGAAFFLGDPQDALVIVVVVAINTFIGAVEEMRASRALAALRDMSAPTARVRRSGEVLQIAASEIVPGDIVFVQAGDIAPVDGRLLSTVTLQVDESALTGESIPADKQADLTLPPQTALPDRDNMLFLGTSVTFGHARLVATSTGSSTEMGRLAQAVAEARAQATPLERQVVWLAKVLSLLALAASASVLALGLLRGQPLGEMLLVAASLAVASVPSGLPAVVTVVLALGVQRMARRNAIIRRLGAVEALGAATVICTDKTGTLTLGEMRTAALMVGGRLLEVREAHLWEDGRRVEPDELPILGVLLRAAVLCNNASLDPSPVGDPTERALLHLAYDFGVDHRATEVARPRLAELPFSSDRKRMTTIHRSDDGISAFVKGAPDVVLGRCSRILATEGSRPLDREQLEGIASTLHHLAGQGLRVLALAERPLVGDEGAAAVDDPDAAIEVNLTLIGLVALLDPPRPEVADALAATRAAGIRTVMITGDHPATAGAIARRLGIAGPSADWPIVSGADLERMDEATLAATSATASVYARVAPQQKLEIVRALQAAGEVVAMTGDGANDAPALRRADIGVAMGIRGTEVAKEAADIVLTDDHYATIVAAVEEGRTIFANLQKTVLYLLSGNFGEILVLFLAMLIGLQLPLHPVQILWVNLVTDALPGAGLGMDRPERGLMAHSPRRPGESFLPRWTAPLVIVPSILLALVTLAAFSVTLGREDGNLVAAQSAAFATLALAHLGMAWPLRNTRGSVLKVSPLTNPVLLTSAVVGAGLLLLLLYTGPGQALFHTHPLDLMTWAFVLVLVPVPFLGAEAVKTAFFGPSRLAGEKPRSPGL